jgi:hypothetical protein
MVGEGVLLQCLRTADVTQILVVGRQPCGHQHLKLREILHKDFFDLAPIDKEIADYDACFFCLGVSSVGVSPEDYKRLTYDLTLEMGRRLAQLTPQMTFCYVTGMHTDSSEKGSVRWARVKGATENELLRLFKHAYMFRPGAMSAVPGQKNLKLLYKVLVPLFPIFKPFLPNSFCTLEEVGRAMLTCARSHPASHIVEVADIKAYFVI